MVFPFYTPPIPIRAHSHRCWKVKLRLVLGRSNSIALKRSKKRSCNIQRRRKNATLPTKDAQSHCEADSSCIKSINPMFDLGSSSVDPQTQRPLIHHPSFSNCLTRLGLGSSVELSACVIETRFRVCADLPLATCKSDVYESAGVCYSFLRATFGGLLLLLWLNLSYDIY
jgi:hypothetical protein